MPDTSMSLSQSNESIKICEFLDRFTETNYALRKVSCDIYHVISMCWAEVSEYWGTQTTMLSSGSFIDGTLVKPREAMINEPTLSSDLDLMMVLRTVNVINKFRSSRGAYKLHINRWVFEMTNCCNPLFVKLKFISRPHQEYQYDNIIKLALKENKNKGIFLSSSTVVEKFGQQYSFATKTKKFEIHGTSYV